MLSRDIKEILARVTVAVTGRLGATWRGGYGAGAASRSDVCLLGKRRPLFPFVLFYTSSLPFMYNFPQTHYPSLSQRVHPSVVTLMPLSIASLLSRSFGTHNRPK